MRMNLKFLLLFSVTIAAWAGPASAARMQTGGTANLSDLSFFDVFYEYLSFGSPDRVQGTNVTYETSWASHTAYGKAEFSHSVSSQTNCAEFDGVMVRNFDSGEDVRLENFSVWRGTATDGNDQRFVMSISSMTNGDIQTSITFVNPINVDLTDSATGNANSVLALTSPVTLTGWASEMVAGAPYVIQVCRDGDAAQDSSTINSFLARFQVRVGQTAP